jgi:hypothetical protein
MLNPAFLLSSGQSSSKPGRNNFMPQKVGRSGTAVCMAQLNPPLNIPL